MIKYKKEEITKKRIADAIILNITSMAGIKNIFNVKLYFKFFKNMLSREL